MVDFFYKQLAQLSLEDWNTLSAIGRNVALTLGVVGVAIGIWLAWRRTKALETQTGTDAERLARQSKAEAERQIAETFTRAIDQLGSDKLEIRLGAIYALERIAQSSKRDHWPIMETLTAFIREHAPAPQPEIEDGASLPIEPENIFVDTKAEIQAVLTVLGRRTLEHEDGSRRLDLTRTNLSRYDFQRACIPAADLQNSYFWSANLSDATVRGVNLECADLKRAILTSADLRDANLSSAKLEEANLNNANLARANLKWASLYGANLSAAILTGVCFANTKLGNANLRRADLTGAKQLTQKQLNAAFGDDETKLPPGLTVAKRNSDKRN